MRAREHKATFIGREHEQPVKPLVRSRKHELEPGMVCDHISVPDERWVVVSVDGFWCRAAKGRGDDRIEQSFPVDALLPHVVVRTVPGVKAKVPVVARATHPANPSRPRKERPLDAIAQRLADFDTLDQLWEYAFSQGIEKAARKRCAHLNNGLQRMWIGNTLRKKKTA